MKLLPLLLIALLFSCSPQKRLNRLLKAHPELVKKDTIWRLDTTIIKEVKTDSVFHYLQPDTLTIVKDRLTMKYFYNVKDSTVYLSGKCDTVFVVKKIPVTINSVTGTNGGWFDWWKVVAIALALLCLYLILKR